MVAPAIRGKCVMRSGVRIDLANPRLDLIRARDIGESLAKQAMYLGRTNGFYSLAQHSCVVAAEIAREEGPQAALYALLHHAEDAFDGGMRESVFTREPTRLIEVLYGAFDLDWPAPQSLARAFAYIHSCVELSELRQLRAGCETEAAEYAALGAKPIRALIRPIAWDRAYDRYIEALKVNAVAAHLRAPALDGVL